MSGHNNWFCVSIDPNLTVDITKPAQQLYVNFDEAGDEAVKLIARDWGNKPLYLALSGGLDSEFIADRLVKNQIDFVPVILKVGDYNSIETWYAEYWCYKNNKVPTILNYTISEFETAWAQFGPQLAELRNYNLVPQCILYDYANQHNAHLIYGAGDMQFDVNSQDQFYLHSFDLVSDIASVGDHPTSFYMYTPELLLSYIAGYDLDLSENYNKINAYGVSPRPKIGYQQSMADDPKYFEFKHHLSVKFNTTNVVHNQSCYFGTREQIMKKLTT
jgi:uncharacterized protein YneR